MLLPDVSGVRILVVGDVMLDTYIHGTVDRISQEAPVPVVALRSVEHRAGGAANVAASVAALGSRVYLVGVSSPDPEGRVLRTMLPGVEHALAEGNTTVKTRIVGPGGQQMLRLDADADATPAAARDVCDLARSLLASVDLVVLSDYGRGALAGAQQIIQAAAAVGKPVYVDPKGDWERYRGAALIKPNADHIRQRVGKYDTTAELARLVDRAISVSGIAEAVVTLGAGGMLHQRAYSDAQPLHIPAASVAVADVTGAGDTVMAVLAVMRAAGAPIADAMRTATVAASIAVQRRGTATVSRAELFEALTHA